MASSARRQAAHALLAFAMGTTMAAAWSSGFVAAGIVALLVGLWAVVASYRAWRSHERHGRAGPEELAPGHPADRAALASYLDASPLPLLLLEGQERLTTLNRGARAFFGAQDRIVAPPAGLVEAIRTTRPGQAARIDLPIGGDALGALRPFALATSDVAGPLGDGRIAALTDIDAELRAAEAATLRDLVRVLGHEIANSLTPIASLGRTASDILGDDAPDMPTLREAVDTIARRAEGLQRFGEAYRQLSRLPAPQIERFEAAVLLADLDRLFRTRWPAITLDSNFERAPTTICADRDQLSAALWAVLQNAAEAADKKRPAVTLECFREKDATVFRVKDNGAGIAPDRAEEIFQPFITYKKEGTGVGLALARQILRSHRGDVVAEVPQEAGACFRMVLAN